MFSYAREEIACLLENRGEERGRDLLVAAAGKNAGQLGGVQNGVGVALSDLIAWK